MRTHVRVIFAASLMLGLSPFATHAGAQTAVAASFQIGDFRLAVSNYYHVPEREVVVIHERRVRDEELPVVFFMAQHAHVSPSVIVDLRLRGMSWWSISTRYHIGPEVYYVPVSVAPGPPYGKAYGYYKKPRNQWKTIVLSDDDVVNMVQLRFVSDHYHMSPEKVMESRGKSGSFMAVHREASSHGNSKKGDDKKSSASQGSNSQGNGNSSNGRGRGRGGL